MANYIHYNPDRTEYSVSEEELGNLKDSAQPLWKDVCIASISLGLPTLINAITQTFSKNPFSLDLSLFLNYLFGVLGVLFGIIFGIAWHKSSNKTESIYSKIKSKPKIELPASTSNIGALPDNSGQ